MQMNDEQSVYIIDDDATLLKAVKWLLESVDLKVITYTSPAEYLKDYSLSWRGCLLLDIRMPHMSGLELQEELVLKGNQMPVILISGHGDIPMAVRAMKAGAFNFMVKPFNDQLLLEQVQKALKLDKEQQPETLVVNAINSRYALLSTREREVMGLVVGGKLNKQIASDLGISLSTVELHRSHVMQKMQAKTVANLVKFHMMINAK